MKGNLNKTAAQLIGLSSCRVVKMRRDRKKTRAIRYVESLVVIIHDVAGKS